MDVTQYRRAEKAARRALRSWRQSQMMNPVVFERNGFPSRIDSMADLLEMIDTMQEGRFDLYMKELGGLEAMREVPWFVAALTDFVRFFAATFHDSQVRLPLSTMLSHLALAIKLLPWITPDSRVLEIGPGCGYLPFLIKGRIRSYDQIETTECFYLLQQLVNHWCYGEQAREYAAEAPPARVEPLLPMGDYETPVVALDNADPHCAHWPWWLAAAAKGPFDVITSNANLSEMADNALCGYAELMRRTLTAEGVLIVQCFGGGHENTTSQRIFNVLAGVGLKPLFIAGRSPLVVGNGVFVRGEWDGSLSKDTPDGEIRIMDDPRIRAMFLRDGIKNRRVLSPSDVAAMVQDELLKTASRR
jgi:hypothetical protein